MPESRAKGADPVTGYSGSYQSRSILTKKMQQSYCYDY